MNTKRLFISIMTLLMISFVLAGCASSTPTLSPTAYPTSVPLTCPTAYPTSAPLSCPTGVAQVQPTPNSWRQGYSTISNIVITFDKGDNCSLDVVNRITEPDWSYEIVVNDTTYQNYTVVVLQLEEGKTITDLADWNENNSLNPPPWSDIRMLEIVEPGSSTWHGITLSGSPAYLVCIVQGPGDQKVLGQFGPFIIP